MLLLVVTTLSSAVLADAGYQYNVPSSRLSYNQPAIFHPLHNSQPHDVKIVQGIQEEDKSISYSVSYKDYVYLKKDNIDNNNAHFHQLSPNYNNVHVHGNTLNAASNGGVLASQNTQTNIGHLNNGYRSYSQPVSLPANLNSNYGHVLPAASVQSHHVQSHYHHHAATPTFVGTNTGYAQAQPANNNLHSAYAQTNHLPASGSYSNRYAPSSSASANQHSVYAQTTAPDVNNYYSYSQISAPSAPAGNLNNVYAQNLIPIGANDLNNGYVHSAAAAGTYNGYAQGLTQQANAPLNNGYSQPAHASVSLASGQGQAAHTNAPVDNGYSQAVPVSVHSNNGYNQAVPARVPSNSGYNKAVPASVPSNNGYSQATSSAIASNSGYQHSFPSSPNFGLNSAYAQTVLPTHSADHNTGYAQTSSSTIGDKLNNGNDQALIPTGSANLDTGYGLPSTSSAANVNNAFQPIVLSPASGSSSISYSQASTGPTHVDLNSVIPQSLSPTVTALDNSFTQTLTSASGNLNAAVNPSSVSAPNSPSVTPIIHKHIYFHVPPPEIEEPVKVVPPPAPPKKNYKILFIKVPSQNSKSNIIRLQQEIAQRQNAAVEDKTLIYVLVKNPEDPKPVILPKHKPSEHEVFFVKYNGNPFDIASQVSDEFDTTGSVKSIVPLQPGLVNGQHK